jgi:uncharacterized membrane protein
MTTLNSLQKNWLIPFLLLGGIFVSLPFLAPVLMHIGWTQPAKVIYFIYSFLCHQLPQRSFFLFGEQFTYPLTEIQNAWQFTADVRILRDFIGNPGMGWKVAWSDRMVAMYTSIWFFSMIWARWLRKVNLTLLGLSLLILPLAIDGTTHMISDFAGIGQGFRDSNFWLVQLTNRSLPVSFYQGDMIGSFNSWMRLVTGSFFGLGIALFGLPHFDLTFGDHTQHKENSNQS